MESSQLHLSDIEQLLSSPGASPKPEEADKENSNLPEIIIEEESSLKLAGSDYSFIFSDLPHFEDDNETRND